MAAESDMANNRSGLVEMARYAFERFAAACEEQAIALREFAHAERRCR